MRACPSGGSSADGGVPMYAERVVHDHPLRNLMGRMVQYAKEGD
ncbi:MAG: hypothetical protein RXQ62_04500 [Nitrososphaeria archaeon]